MHKNPQKNIRLIAGLGNPGEKYASTRHNAGFMVIDSLITKMRGKFTEKSLHNAVFWEGKCKGLKLFMVKPLTYMNASGEAVELIARKNSVLPEETVIIYDDMDLPLGRIRIREGGGTGGHNGVESVINKLGSSDFARVRVGIGRGEGNEQITHVLSEFNKNEKDVFVKAVDFAADAAKFIVYRGIADAMNKYNGHEIINFKED